MRTRSLTASASSLLGAGLVLLAVAGTAQARFVTGLTDAVYQSSDTAERELWLDRTAELGASIVRLDVSWRAVAAGGQPQDAANPADPAYDFTALDAAVRDATARGFTVMFTVYNVPDFAEGADRPADQEDHTWKPDPDALGGFARALATRYSGSFGGLPSVRYFEAWNEANLSQFLTPQWEGGQPFAVEHYRKLLDAVAENVKAVSADNQVIAGSLAPYGDPPGENRTRPVYFLRKLLCLKKSLKASKCPVKPEFDILSHHPINYAGPPTHSAVHPDDAATADLERVTRTLRAAERARTISGPRRRHPVWATELWWESDPPDPNGVKLAKHARWIEQAMYLLWKDGAKALIYYNVRDEEFSVGSFDTGLFTHGGEPKPAATAFRFPLVGERKSEDRVTVWGRTPESGKVRVQVKKGGRWVSRATIRSIKAGGTFSKGLRLTGRAKLRATVGTQTSLTWKQSAR